MSNVLVIVTDDQRYDELLYMPNARRFLQGKGTSFDWCRTNVPLCGPARTGILTGQYSRYHGVVDNASNPTLAAYNGSVFVALHNAGFRVGMVGKFLSGLAGGPGGTPPSPKPGFDFWRAISGDGGSGYGIYEPQTYTIFNGTSTISPNVYQDHYLAGQAIDFMRGTEPWCLWYCPTSPHWPFSSPPNHQNEWTYRHYPTVSETALTDKPSWIQSLPVPDAQILADVQADEVQRLRELLAVDDAIGAFANLMSATGLDARTTILFTSDNGNMLGEHNLVGGTGARAGLKNTPYDPSMRVPMLAVGPGFAHKSVVAPTIHQDITATMLDIAGATAMLPNQAGVSLRAIAANPSTYTGRNTLHHRENLTPEGSPDPIPSADGVVTSQYKLWRYIGQSGTDQYELYDLLNDPDELVNRANDSTGSWPTLRASLDAVLTGLLA